MIFRWFTRMFDKRFVKCTNCRREYLYADVARKNKCPDCKLENHGHLPKTK